MAVRGVPGRWVSGLGVAGAFLLWMGLGAQASVELGVLSPPRTVSPGELAIHVFSVSNRSASPLEVALSVALPPGWGQLGLPSTLSIPAGDEEAVFLTVVVPRIAAAGAYAVRLTAAWPGGEASAEAEVRVVAVAGVVLVPPKAGEAQPGDSVTYDLSVVNRGNVLDRFAAEASSAHGWPVRVEPKEFSLGPGERGAVRVVLSIPADAEPGRELLWVTVRSREGADARTAWFTTVHPPGPEAIVGTAFSELEMRLGGRLGYDLLSRRRLSLLTLVGDGEVLGGTVDLVLHATGPWGPAPYRVSRFSFAYEGNWAWAKVGEVGLDLSSLLLSVGGTGMAAGIETGPGTAALVTGWGREEGRFGFRGAWRGRWGELGLAVRETREGSRVSAGALWGTVRILEGLALRGEGGVALVGPYLDTGFLAGLGVTGPGAALDAEAYIVGPWLPSARADRAGISLSARLTAPPLGVRSTTHWVRDNVLGSPLVPTVVRSDLTTALDWAPSGWPVALFSTGTLRRSQGSGPGANLDRRVQILDLGASLGEAPLAIRLHGRWRWEEDLVALSTERTEEYGQRFTLTLGRTKALLTLTQAATYDALGALLSAGSEVALDLRLPGEMTLGLRYSRDGGRVEAELPFTISPAFSARARVEMRWDPAGGATALYGEVGFEYTFRWQPPFLPAKGWLEGSVFVDENGNGRADPGEEGVAGAVLVADGVTVASGKDGRFLFPPLPPGAYRLAVERLPQGVRSRIELPLPVEVALAGRTRVAIPCVRLGEISGTVYDDEDKSGRRDHGERGLRGVVVILEREGKEIDRAYTDPLGGFSFPDLAGGEYWVRVDPGSLPERYELTTPAVVVVRLRPGAAEEVLFGAWQKPRPVVVVYQPPVADFSWSPPVARAGQPVMFDARASHDPDGRIVAYSWDFTGDGVSDAQGALVTWVFPSPDFYLVALTVTDNDGHRDRLELLVQVVP